MMNFFNQQPALMDPNQQQQQPGLLGLAMQQGQTGNARGSGRIPQQQIGLGEGLMRIGGAGLSNATQGGLGQMGAMLGQYGEIQDYNRQREMEQFQAEEARRVEEARRADLQRRLNAGQKQNDANPEAVIQADNQIQTMEAILDGLKQGGVTGLWDGTAGRFLDRTGLSSFWEGSEAPQRRAYVRQLLQEFKVDQTLLKVAETKGAISNQEMQLFMSPFPDLMLDDESAWIPQIEKRLDIAKRVRAAAAGMPYVPQNTQPADTGGFKILSVEEPDKPQ